MKAKSLVLSLLILAGCQTKPSFDFGPYSEAERLYEKGKYKEAARKYEEYIQENPKGNMAAISAYYMGKCYEALGEPEKAKALYEGIVRKHGDLIWADFSRTRLLDLKEGSAEKKKT